MSRKNHKPFYQNKISSHQNVHHLFPSSRYQELKNVPSNMIRISVSEHTLFHALFTNRNPYECIDYLVKTFFGGRIGYLEDYLRNVNKRKEKHVPN